MARSDDRSRSEEVLREITSRRESGEEVNPEEYVMKHPEMEEELQMFFAKLKAERTDEAGSRSGSEMPDAVETPRIIGDFRIIREIGRGGMGTVFEAEQKSLNKKVALKVLLPERVDKRAIAFFAREARAGGRLSHPGIVTVFAAGESEGIHYIAQELVTGRGTLRDFIDDARAKSELEADHYRKVAELFAAIADALQTAHDSDVIHRDLKPQNILITDDGRPKVTDFGLAKITTELSISRTGDIAGTYFYMSPEQVTARRIGIDSRTDIFSLGVVLYEALVTARPFDGDTSHQVAERILFHDPPSA